MARFIACFSGPVNFFFLKKISYSRYFCYVCMRTRVRVSWEWILDILVLANGDCHVWNRPRVHGLRRVLQLLDLYAEYAGSLGHSHRVGGWRGLRLLCHVDIDRYELCLDDHAVSPDSPWEILRGVPLQLVEKLFLAGG